MRQICACDQGQLELAITLTDDVSPNKSGRVFLDDFCARQNIPLIKVENINDDKAMTAIREAGLDWLFIIGWSQIAKPALLAAVRRGCLGMHPTLLPVGRGRASIPWAILKSEERTGVTLFMLDKGVDTGPIIGQASIDIAPRETATSLYAKVANAHQSLIRKIWPQLIADEISPRPQDESKATYWPGRKPEDGEIQLTMSRAEADRLIRAVTRPYPGAFLRTDCRRLRIWAAQPDDVCEVPSGIENEADGTLLIPFGDGCLRATDWEWDA